MISSIKNNYAEFPATSFAIKPTNNKSRQELIRTIALASIKEAVISFTLSGITCYFVAAAAIPTLLVGTISVIALNTFIRCISGACVLELQKMEHQGFCTEEELNYYQFLDSGFRLTQLLCPLSFSVLDTTTKSVLIHEAGHALAATTLYQNSQATIEIFSF